MSDNEHEQDEQQHADQQQINIQPDHRPNFSRIEFPKLANAQSVEYWFIRLESWFRLQNVTDESVRYEAIVSSLTPQLFDQVVDIITAPPQVEPYKTLKAALIEKFADSEYTRVDKLLSTVPLGSQRPSHLLAEIRRAGATKDDKILRVCWMRRLPVTVRTILSASRGSLAELAAMADATYDTLQAENVFQVSSHASSAIASSSNAFANASAAPALPANNDLIKCIEALSLQINELHKKHDQQKPRGREYQRKEHYQRSSSRAKSQQRDHTPANNRQPTCWYHRNFGTQARKCEPPCDFSTVQPKQQ